MRESGFQRVRLAPCSPSPALRERVLSEAGEGSSGTKRSVRCTSVLSMRRTGADVERGTIGTSREKPTVVIGIKGGESVLVPHAAMLDLARIGDDVPACGRLRYHTALSLRKANSTMRRSMNPSRNREICVSP